jgi:hypothetical protein
LIDLADCRNEWNAAAEAVYHDCRREAQARAAMTFSIKFVDRMLHADGTLALTGELILNDVTESFTAAVDAENGWTQTDYEMQWRDGLKRIVDGKRKSCLVTCLPHPEWSDALFHWPMYRLDDQVVFRHRLVLPEKLPRRFDPAKPYRIVSERSTRGKVSEWRVGFADIADFYERMAPTPDDKLIETTFEKPGYFHPEELPRVKLEAEFKSGDPDRIYAAFLNAAYFDDAAWVQAKGIEALASPVAVVRWGALAALQILAAVRRELDPAVVLTAVMPLIDDPDKDVREVAKDVLNDIKWIFGQ